MQEKILKGFNEYLQTIGDQTDYETLVDMEVMLARLLTHKKRLYDQAHGFTRYTVSEYLCRSRNRRAYDYHF